MGPLHHHDDGGVPAQSLVEAETDRLVLDGHLHIQAVVSAAFAVPRGSHRVFTSLHDFRDGALQPFHVAADHLVNPEAGVVDPGFRIRYRSLGSPQEFVNILQISNDVKTRHRKFIKYIIALNRPSPLFGR